MKLTVSLTLDGMVRALRGPAHGVAEESSRPDRPMANRLDDGTGRDEGLGRTGSRVDVGRIG